MPVFEESSSSESSDGETATVNGVRRGGLATGMPELYVPLDASRALLPTPTRAQQLQDQLNGYGKLNRRLKR